MFAETIKSYLVSLGFQVEQGTFDSAKKAMATVEKGLEAIAGKAVASFAKASLAVGSFVAAASVGTAKFLDSLGHQEIQMEMLSRQLWTTQQQAMAFNASLKALGANLQDLYLSPTLMKQYEELHAMAVQMQTPTDYNQTINAVQTLSLEFAKMKLAAYYALQWIGYYFTKYMFGPIQSVQGLLDSINNAIVKNMPGWTKQAAVWMASFMQAGINIGKGLRDVWNWLKQLAAYIPGWAKAIAAALAVLSVSNPFMLFVEGIGTAMLLWDDFQTYLKDPSKSAFPQVWAWVEKTVTEFKKLRIGQQIAQDVGTALQWLGDTAQHVAGFVLTLIATFEKNGTIKAFTAALLGVWQALKDVADAVGSVITGIGHLFGLFNHGNGENDVLNFFQLLADAATTAVKIVAGALEEVASLVQIVGDALHGNWEAAGKVLQNMWTGQNLANIGVISQSVVAGPMPYGSQAPTYTLPRANTPTGKSVTVHFTQNNTIHGASDPQKTATTLQNTFNKSLHNIRGVIK